MRINLKTMLRLVIAIILLSIFCAFLKYSGFIGGSGYKHINITVIREFLKSSGKWSVPLFIIIYALRPIALVLPASLLSVIGGALYGPFLGTLYTLIGAFLSATVAFYIAKFLGRDAVEKILKGKKIASFDDGIENNGFRIMLFLRLSFIFPYDALSYASGLSKMSYQQFISGTMLGILPEMITYNLFGGNINRPFNKDTVIAISIVLLLAITTLLLKPKNGNIYNK